jgi:glycerol 3-phosphatase-2
VLVVGGEGLRTALVELGLEPVDGADDNPMAVVQGFHPTVGWRALAEGAIGVSRGLPWVASNLDRTIPTARGLAPGNGALVDTVAAAAGRRPDAVAGKPHRPLFDETLLRIECSRPLIVGDRLDTDIEGARRSEADSLLVMTGVTDLATICTAGPEHRPTYIAATLEGLLEPFAAPTYADGSWRLAGWQVRCQDGRLEVVQAGDDRDAGLAAVVSAAWRWYDENDGADLGGIDHAAATLRLQRPRGG